MKTWCTELKNTLDSEDYFIIVAGGTIERQPRLERDTHTHTDRQIDLTGRHRHRQTLTDTDRQTEAKRTEQRV